MIRRMVRQRNQVRGQSVRSSEVVLKSLSFDVFLETTSFLLQVAMHLLLGARVTHAVFSSEMLLSSTQPHSWTQCSTQPPHLDTRKH